MLYKVTIDAVDGEHFYIAGGSHKPGLLAFLERFDHEGSTVTLEIDVDVPSFERPHVTVTDPERIYAILSKR